MLHAVPQGTTLKALREEVNQGVEVDKEDKSKSLQAKLSYLLSSQHGNTYNDLSICSAIMWNMICAEIDRMQMRK